MNRLRLACWSLSLAILVIPAAVTGQQPAPLNVYAAASLTEAFRDLGRLLEQRHAGMTIHFNFAGSQQLATQLEQGAEADVFASADQRWMDFAREKNLFEGDSPTFARNRLVVIVPRANPARLRGLGDLTHPIKLVIAAEAVPAGKYTREALEKLATAPGFPPDYARRVLANVVSEEETVKNVVAKVQLGEADAGFVYQSDVTPAVSPKVRVITIPERFNVIASYPIAVLKSARNPDGARQFVELVLSHEGQRVLQRHGLLSGSAADHSVDRP